MKLVLVTVAFDVATGAFPPDPLGAIDGEVVSVVEHFFVQSGVPHLLLVVHHRPRAASRDKTSPRDDGPRSTLTDDERALYDRLRTWRTGRAQVEAVPPYVVFSNRQIAAIARLRPVSATALAAIEGIGEAKVAKFGHDVLAVVAHVD